MNENRAILEEKKLYPTRAPVRVNLNCSASNNIVKHGLLRLLTFESTVFSMCPDPGGLWSLCLLMLVH